ncbi:MAG: hypothetical protein HC828_02600 [Blastochloris sp.]|nr:hypothetical protein [Blastochloris sp.]
MHRIAYRWFQRTVLHPVRRPPKRPQVPPLQRVQGGAVLIILLVTMILSVAVVGRTQKYLIRQNEDYARQLAFHLNDVLYDEFAYLLRIQPSQPLPDTPALDQSVRRILIGLDVTRLAIYDHNGREVYTTDAVASDENAPGGRSTSLADALMGRPMSTFLSATLADGRRSERILASYVPIYPPNTDRSGAVVGAFAIEQDLSIILVQLQREQLVIAGLVIGLMAMLLSILLAGLGWAGYVISAQHTQLRERNRALHELQQARDDLTRLIVHDLRSPLTAIVGYLDLLRLMDRDPERQGLITTAIGSARHMTHLISTILDLQQLQERSMPLERRPIDLAELLAISAEEYCGWAQRDAKTIQVETAPDLPLLVADPDLIRRMVANLVSNALKHTPAGTTIRLTAHRDHSGQWILLMVHDDGPGIAADIVSRVFEPYVRGAKRSGGGSTGLGLAFCKLATEAHGGTISVASAPDHGTTFTVLLPIHGAPEDVHAHPDRRFVPMTD